MEDTFNYKAAAKDELYEMLKVFNEKLHNYEARFKEKAPLEIKEIDSYDYINPAHYVQDDGRQTWERMLDHWTPDEVALWCEMTVFKYQDRKGKKPNEEIIREQKKIDWYKKKAIDLRTNNY